MSFSACEAVTIRASGNCVQADNPPARPSATLIVRQVPRALQVMTRALGPAPPPISGSSVSFARESAQSVVEKEVGPAIASEVTGNDLGPGLPPVVVDAQLRQVRPAVVPVVLADPGCAVVEQQVRR